MASERSGRRAANHGQENIVVNKRPPSSGNRFLRHSNSSSLEILESEDSLKIGSNHVKDFHKENRPGSSGKKNSGSVPPRPDSTLTRRTPTPTKQISLQAVRRKEENDDPIVADVDWKELQSHSRNKGRKDVPTTQLKEMSISDKTGKSDKSSIPFSYSSNHHNCSHHVDKPERRVDERVKLASKPTKESHVTAASVDKSEEEEEEEDSSSSEEEEEERKAPNQLLMEFVTTLMDKDYVSAEKLCKMILLYEPENQEALKFQPLIEEKIALDKEPEYESEESDGEEGYNDENEDDDEDDDDEDDDGTEDDDSDSSDSDSDSDEDDSEQEEQRVDSGIASAAGSEFNV